MNEYYHRFNYTNSNRVHFEIGVEVILASDESLKYRIYDTKEEEPQEVVDLRPCPLTRDKKPSIRGIERQVMGELVGWVHFGLPRQ